MPATPTALVRRALACLLLAASPAWATDADDWGARLESDVRAFHAALSDSHPGPVDKENPAFSGLLDDGLAAALARVPATRDHGGYWWALREFQASFDDGHVQLRSTDRAPALPLRWPGFLTREARGQHRVAARLDEAGLPAEGARLLDCDGIAADRLARDLVGRFRGNWSLAAQRARHGGRMFLDNGNPWVERPRSCRFEQHGRIDEYTLDWRALDDATFETVFARTYYGHRAPIAVRDAPGGLLWLSLSGFDGNTESTDYAALTTLLETLRDDARVGRAQRVVLDLRGNSGGSSHWSQRIAALLWGDAAARDARPASGAVDWRVSRANLAAIHEYQAMFRAQEAPDPESLHWADTIAAGMAAAMARDEALWRHPPADDDRGDADRQHPRRLAADAKVFVLTDAACASACLDALDLWLALDAVHVGAETSADTLYMDTRSQPLPSGLTEIAVPMKVYRGRPRGNNEPYVPVHAYAGDFADDAALEAWIGGL